jgi:transglycosylase-like protein
MRKTTTALALAGSLLAAPAASAASEPAAPALHPPLAGHRTVAAQMQAAHVEDVRADLTARAARLARRADMPAAAERRRARGRSPAALRKRIDGLEDRIAARRREAAAPAASPVLEGIAQCESGGDPTTDTGNGFYGKYQFTLATWASVGGSGNPAQASEAEQDRRAAALYAQAGPSPWPVCGR